MLTGGAPVLDVHRPAVRCPGGDGRASACAHRSASGAAVLSSLGRDPAAVGDRVRVDRAGGRTRQRSGPHVSGAGRRADPRGTRARMALARRAPGQSGSGPASVCARLGRSRRPGGGGRGAHSLGPQLCGARRAPRRGDASTVAGRRHRCDGRGGYGTGRLRPAPEPEQCPQCRPSGGGTAEASERRVRLGGDGLRGPVRGRAARCAARGHGRTLAAAAHGTAHGAPGGWP